MAKYQSIRLYICDIKLKSTNKHIYENIIWLSEIIFLYFRSRIFGLLIVNDLSAVLLQNSTERLVQVVLSKHKEMTITRYLKSLHRMTMSFQQNT